MPNTMKTYLLLAIPLLGFMATSRANETPAPNPIPVAVPSSSENWLDAKGVYTLDGLLQDLGATPDAAQKEAVARALASRNMAVQQGNARLSQELKKILGVNDDIRAKEQVETRKMNRIKRLQPGRYQGLDKKPQPDASPIEGK